MKRAAITICHILANLAFKLLFKKSPLAFNKSEAVEETEELNEAINRVNNWYVMTPRALFWHQIETKFFLTVNH